MSDELKPIKFFAGAFFATFLFNFFMFVLAILFIINMRISAVSINVFLVVLNVLANVVAYRAMSNRYLYRSFLYGQIIGVSLAGLLITLCGGLITM